MRFHLMHINGCGGSAVELARMPVCGEIIDCTIAIGVSAGDPCQCRACGKPLGPMDFSIEFVRGDDDSLSETAGTGD